MSRHPRIRHMVKVMKEKDALSNKKNTDKKWLLYILKCCDGTFYTGVTNDLERRLKMHQSGKASKFTRARRPVTLYYQEPCGSKTDAFSREFTVKGYTRIQKAALGKD